MGKETKDVMKENQSVTGPETVQEEIRTLAYQLFCECGCTYGHDVEHWIEAERQVCSRQK